MAPMFTDERFRLWAGWRRALPSATLMESGTKVPHAKNEPQMTQIFFVPLSLLGVFAFSLGGLGALLCASALLCAFASKNADDRR